MRWCRKCILPDTRPNLAIGADGVCGACGTHQTKKNIDWAAREEMFREVAAAAKGRSRGYDCLIPVSGGKDSTWQVLKCLEHGLNPLAVTWKTPARTEIGRRNLENLISLGVDHIDYQISPKVEAKFMLETFEKAGSTGIPMHMAIFNIPLTIAVRFAIPLVVWGENSAFEYGGADDALKGFRLDRKWLESYGVTGGTTAGDWVGGNLGAKELTAYFGPDQNELDEKDVRAVFLGYYFPWDPATSFEVARRHGFRENAGKPRTGFYDFADIDDAFISIHHWMKWYKFGFTRLFDNLSLEIRNRRITREEAIEIVRERGVETPHGDIAEFCAFAGIDEARFFEIAERFRNPDVWRREADGRWVIPGFLIEDWEWT